MSYSVQASCRSRLKSGPPLCEKMHHTAWAFNKPILHVSEVSEYTRVGMSKEIVKQIRASTNAVFSCVARVIKYCV